MNSTSSLSPATPVARDAIRLIRDEHSRLAAVIHGMLHLSRQMAAAKAVGELKVLRAMMFYISEYPERLHHPKEDAFLFARLKMRNPELDGVLDQLHAQHHQGEARAHQLEHLLIRLEFDGEGTCQAFAGAVQDYADFYFSHMRMEEDIILPAAEKLLNAEDWLAIRDAFSANSDPLENKELKGDFERLFSLIVNIAPAPIGLGAAQV